MAGGAGWSRPRPRRRPRRCRSWRDWRWPRRHSGTPRAVTRHSGGTPPRPVTCTALVARRHSVGLPRQYADTHTAWPDCVRPRNTDHSEIRRFHIDALQMTSVSLVLREAPYVSTNRGEIRGTAFPAFCISSQTPHIVIVHNSYEPSQKHYYTTPFATSTTAILRCAKHTTHRQWSTAGHKVTKHPQRSHTYTCSA